MSGFIAGISAACPCPKHLTIAFIVWLAGVIFFWRKK